MSKILFIGDPHLKITKFNLSMRFLSWLDCTIHELSPDLVVNLGDTFDTHSVVRSEIMSEFVQHVRHTVERAPYIYVLGNHDMYKPSDSTYHALMPLMHVDNFTVIDKPTQIGDTTYVPYIHDFKEFPLIKTPICVAHQTFVGCDYGYYRPDIGVDADKVAAEIIISGHIHKRQMFGKVIYPGTPFAQGLDDINQSKGVMLFDTETYKYEFIESPLPKWRGMKFQIAQDFSVDYMHRQILSELTEKDHWVLDMTGPKAELVAYMDSSKLKFLRETYDIRVRANYTDKIKEKAKIKASSMEDILFQYINNIYDGALDKGIIKDKALEILRKTP